MEDLTSRSSRTISAGLTLALIVGFLLWRQVHTPPDEAAARIAEPSDAPAAVDSERPPVPATDSAPPPLTVLAENLSVSGDAAQRNSEGERQRLNKFFLNHYYPDLERETGFGPDDRANLVRLKGSDEAELEMGLGAAQYQRWKEYEARVQSQDVVNKLGRTLQGNDQLSEDQASMLRTSLFDEKRRRDEELRIRMYAAPTDLRSRLEFEFANLAIKEESDRRLLAAVKFFLSERQFAALPEAVIDPNLAKNRESLERLRDKEGTSSASERGAVSGQ